LIDHFEVKEKARDKGVPITTLERDYAQNWFLRSLYENDFRGVLKGGTGLRKVFIEDYRFSEDLDFTLLDHINIQDLTGALSETVLLARELSGVSFLDDFPIKENRNGFTANIYFRFLRNSGDPLRIKLDITKTSMEKVILEPQVIEIIHPYSDQLKGNTLSYQLEELMAEKIRSLFQRTRPRDVYDIWNIRDEVDLRLLRNLFIEKCKHKNLEPDLKSVMERKSLFSMSWKNSLRYLINPLPEFDLVFNDMMEYIKRELLVEEGK